MNDFDKYTCGAKICGIVYDDLKNQITTKTHLDVKWLSDYGTEKIKEECFKVFKKEKNKGVAYPVSISLNDCVGHYIYQESNDQYNTIHDGDVVKIELGVNIGGCVSKMGETFLNTTDTTHEKYIDLLQDLQDIVIDFVCPQETNDEIRINIESKCTEFDCFPVQNTFSYRYDYKYDDDIQKYMTLNYKKKYDMDDNLLVQENFCYEFENNEVYYIELVIVPNIQNEHIYTKNDTSHIYRFNDLYYSLKLKSSREFLTKVKKEHNENSFEIAKHTMDAKSRLGVRECIESGLLENYPILYTKSKTPVFFKKFTIIVTKDKCKLVDPKCA